MRVGVNLLWCRPGRVGGSEEYLVRQLLGLSSVAPEITARLLVPPGFAAAHGDLAERFHLVEGATATRRRGVRVLAEAVSLPRLFADSDVVHHAGGIAPPGRRTPTLLTVHDVQYLRHPEYFSKGRRTYLRLRMPPSVRAADAIAVPSRFVAETVTDAFGVAAEGIVVVPHGFDPPAVDAAAVAATLRRHRLTGRRLLVHPAITHPHKGHRFLVELLAGPWRDPDLVLVMLGGAGAAEQAVTAAILSSGVADRVVRPGRVPAAERDALIAAAEALVFPSEYEGYGAPVLEAMALGTPVICSDTTALPEVVGDAAVVRPLAIDAWAGALADVAAARDALVARGRARAALFTTAASGTALASAYQLAAHRAGDRGR